MALKINILFAIVLTIALSSCSFINRDEFLKTNYENSDWREKINYGKDSSDIYSRTAEFQKDSLYILLSSSQSIIDRSKHGAGSMIAFGPPLLPIIYLGGSVSYAVKEDGFDLTLWLRYTGTPSQIDFSKSKIVLPGPKEYRPTKIGRYERHHPFHYLDSFVISLNAEESMYEIEYELTNIAIFKYCDTMQVVFPPLVKPTGDSIQISPIELIKEHSFKYYPFVITG